MILQEGAKPIRIRIISGGEEHFSLDSLRRNFSLRDIIPTVKDGRLAKWLRQIGETGLVNDISKLNLQSTVSCPIEDEVILLIRFFFPEYKNLSLFQIIRELKESKGKVKTYNHLIAFTIPILPLDFIIDLAENGLKVDWRKEWRHGTIQKLCSSSFQKALELYHKGIFKELLNADDWYRIFTNRSDVKKADACYWVWEDLYKFQGQSDIALDYLKKSAELGHELAMSALRDLDEIVAIDNFLEDQSVFNHDKEKGSEIRHFLKILGVSVWTGVVPKGEAGRFTKYIELCDVLHDLKYRNGFGPRAFKRQIEFLCTKYPDFQVALRIQQAFSQNIKVEDRNILGLYYEDWVAYLVRLMKEYEYGRYRDCSMYDRVETGRWVNND